MLVALGITLGCELLYVTAANLVLATPWLENALSSKPEKLRVEIGRAWTVIPGRVHLEDFRLRLQDRNVQFLLELRDADLDFELSDLLKRRFTVDRLTVDETKFYLRHKLATEAGPVEERRARAYPPIEGFADPPRKQSSSSSSGKGKPWTVRIEDISTTVGELWIQEFRYAGRAKLRGSFELTPGERLWVEGAHVEFARAPLTLGRDGEFLSELEGELRANIVTHSLEGQSTLDLFRHFSGQSKLRATVQSIAVANGYVSDPELRLERGAGPLRVDISVERGRLLPDSRAEYRTDEVRVEHGRLVLRGDGAAVASVSAAAGQQASGELALTAHEIVLSAGGEQALVLRGSELELRTETLSIPESWKMGSGRLLVPQARSPNLVALSRALGADGFRLRGGSAEARVEARLDRRGALHAQVSAQLNQAAFQVDDLRAKATGHLSFTVQQPRLDRDSGSFQDCDLELSQLVVSTRHGTTGSGRLRARADRIPFQKYRPEQVALSFSATFANAEPVLEAIGVLDSTIPEIAANLIDLEDLRFGGQLQHHEQTTLVVLREATTDSARATGAYRNRGKQTDAVFLLSGGIARVGILTQDGQTNVKPFVGGEWLDEQLRRMGLGRTVQGS